MSDEHTDQDSKRLTGSYLVSILLNIALVVLIGHFWPMPQSGGASSGSGDILIEMISLPSPAQSRQHEKTTPASGLRS